MKRRTAHELLGHRAPAPVRPAPPRPAGEAPPRRTIDRGSRSRSVRVPAPPPCTAEPEVPADGRRLFPTARPRALRAPVGHLADARRPDDVDRGNPRPLPPGTPPARRARSHPELRFPPGRLGPTDAYGVLRRHHHLRHHRRRRTGGRPGPPDPPRHRGHRPGHRGDVRRRRTGTAALGALRRGRLLPPGPAPLRLPPHRRPGRPVRRRTPHRRPPRRPRPGPGARHHRRTRRLLRPRTPRPRRRSRGRRRRRLPPQSARASLARSGARPGVAAGGGARLPVPAPVRPRAVRQTGPAATTVDRRLRATGAVLRAIPDRLRWQLPPGHILGAMARLGPGSRPAAYKLRGPAAILDGPGRA